MLPNRRPIGTRHRVLNRGAGVAPLARGSAIVDMLEAAGGSLRVDPHDALSVFALLPPDDAAGVAGSGSGSTRSPSAGCCPTRRPRPGAADSSTRCSPVVRKRDLALERALNRFGVRVCDTGDAWIERLRW